MQIRILLQGLSRPGSVVLADIVMDAVPRVGDHMAVVGCAAQVHEVYVRGLKWMLETTAGQESARVDVYVSTITSTRK